MKITTALRRYLSIFRAAYSGLWQVRVLSWAAVFLAISATAVTLLLQPAKADFMFAEQQCTAGLFVLPSFLKNNGANDVAVVYEQPVKLAGKTVAAKRACYRFSSVPSEHKRFIVSQKLFGLSLLSKNVIFMVGSYPKLATTTLPATISTDKPLDFRLTQPDTFFKYTLKTGSAQANCDVANIELTCNIKSLKLEHSKSYEFLVEQSFNDTQVSTVANMQAVTANPVVLSNDSIAAGATVYDRPTQLTLKADRDVQSISGLKLTGKNGSADPKDIAITSKITGSLITITWAEALPRLTDFELAVTNANSADGGALVEPFKMAFKTSGGPKVVTTTIRDRAVPIGQKIALTLDQTMQPGQNLSSLFGIKVGGIVVPSLVTLSGKTVTITPSSPLNSCTAFQVWAADGALNSFGVGGGSAWSFNSRITCASSFTIGTSVNGRPIIAYRFGSGANTILFNGNLHGNEVNSQRLLTLWIDEIEGNPGRIPADKSIVIIASSNPDGAAANTRTNAHNVDLNRNFPANNWKSTVKMPSGETLDTGGGPTALSEPESSALATYITSLAPRFVMSYHSRGNVVVANDAGNSWALTRTYSSLSGYGAQNGSTIGNFFDYDTTGALEDWLADKKGIPAILVELSTRENDEFNRNKNAMWQVVADF